MAFLAGFIYYLTVFIVYCAAIFGAVKLGILWRKKREGAGRQDCGLKIPEITGEGKYIKHKGDCYGTGFNEISWRAAARAYTQL